jgi:hypothetical protein
MRVNIEKRTEAAVTLNRDIAKTDIRKVSRIGLIPRICVPWTRNVTNGQFRFGFALVGFGAYQIPASQECSKTQRLSYLGSSVVHN